MTTHPDADHARTDGGTTDDAETGASPEAEADPTTDGGTAGPEDATDEGATGATPEVEGDPVDSTGDESEAVAEYLLKGALVLLVVLGVVATLQFYLSATRAIAQLAGDEYRPLFQAAFNLVVLLAAGIGVAQVVRRLR